MTIKKITKLDLILEKEKKEHEGICCFCYEVLDDGFGNNTEPVEKYPLANEYSQKFGRCCNDCNFAVVIPSRMGNWSNAYETLTKEYNRDYQLSWKTNK